MSQLSQEQQDLKSAIAKSALIWAGILGLLVAGIAYWALGGFESGTRILLAVLGGVVTFGGIFFWRRSANSEAAKCAKCNATFSITRTDRAEVLLRSEPQETREDQPDETCKVTTWVEETYDVTDTYSCSQCDDQTTKTYKTTRKTEEQETIESPKPKAGKLESKSAGPKAKKTAGAGKNKK